MLGIDAYKQRLPSPEVALPGRDTPLPLSDRHVVHGRPLRGLNPGEQEIFLGMGCFWGAEKRFWNLPGVVTTAVGYAGGITKNATYEEVCSGQTGHAEVVRVVYDPGVVDVDTLLKTFWESHDPTQGMRQGNDLGTQYRSAIYFTCDAQRVAAERSRDAFQQALGCAGHGTITSEIAPAGSFYFAEDYHQQYLAKNPAGYCGLGGTGISCPVGVVAA